MSNNGLNGTIGSEISNLRNLEFLDVGECFLTGTLPSELGYLGDKLWIMEGKLNDFDGTIPTEIGGMFSLAYTSMDYNRLSGPIPSEFGLLDELAYLSLEGNKLSGSVPSTMSDLDALGRFETNLMPLSRKW